MMERIMKKLDMWFTLGLGDIIWIFEFTKSPYKCIYKLGTREELQDRLRKGLEIKYAQE